MRDVDSGAVPVTHGAAITADILDSSCDPINGSGTGSVVSSAQGDFGGTITWYIGTMNPGTNKVVKMQWSRQ